MSAKWAKKGKEVTGGHVPPSAGDQPARISNKLDHMLVAESKVGRGQSLKRFGQKTVAHGRSKPLAILVVVLVVLAGLIYFGRDDPKPASPAVAEGPKCTYEILQAAKPNLDTRKVVKLEPQARAIEQISGYDTDVNCVYVVLTFYINTSDAPKSRELYNKLVAVYNPVEGYGRVIRDTAQSPKELEATVRFLEEQAEKYQNLSPDGGMKGRLP